ncbi:hypothetical protein EJB05_45223, partial [Eragrostis curvula]
MLGSLCQSFDRREILEDMIRQLLVADSMNKLERASREFVGPNTHNYIRHQGMETGENMKNIVTKLVKKCGCLPLAVLSIGGILATKSIAEWEKFYNSLQSLRTIQSSKQ